MAELGWESWSSWVSGRAHTLAEGQVGFAGLTKTLATTLYILPIRRRWLEHADILPAF